MTVSPQEIAWAWGIEASSVRRPERGTNNLVWIVDDAYVLRVYRNLDASRVGAEHRLLEAITDADPPFAVPVPIPTATGGTIVATPDGPGALYPLLPGRPARSGNAEELELIGAALGDLMTLLSRLPYALAPVDWRSPLSEVHPSVPDVDALVDELRRVAAGAPGLDVFAASWAAADAHYLELDLPCQVCHLDFSPGNALIAEGAVTAILDFEIAGWDLRVNDYVAGLVQSTDRGEEEAIFARGFRSRFSLSDEEWAAVPTLRLLRLLATVVWRAGRWREGKASLDEVRERLAALTT